MYVKAPNVRLGGVMDPGEKLLSNPVVSDRVTAKNPLTVNAPLPPPFWLLMVMTRGANGILPVSVEGCTVVDVWVTAPSRMDWEPERIPDAAPLFAAMKVRLEPFPKFVLTTTGATV